MKDVTKEFFKQHKDYGKKANLNLTRVDIYASKMKNIYRVLGKKRLQIRVLFGRTVARQFPADLYTAMEAVRDYGEIFFLDITYANSRDSVTIKLKDLVPGGLKKVREAKKKAGKKSSQ